MTDAPDPKRPRWQRIREFLAKPPSTGDTIAIGFGVILAVGVFSWVLQRFLIKPISHATQGISEEAVIGSSVGLSFGLLVAWLGTRQYYRLKMLTNNLLLKEAEQEFAGIQQELEDLGEASETLRRIRAYASHLYDLLEKLVANRLSLHDPASDATALAVCEIPTKILATGTERRYVLTIWAEPAQTSPAVIGQVAGFVRENLSDKVGTQLQNAFPGTFEILVGSVESKTAFAVRVSPSWLKHHRDHEDAAEADADESGSGDEEQNRAKRREEVLARLVYSVDEPFAKELNDDPDIKAFRSEGYRAVRAISFRRSGRTCYLVALSKDDGAFTRAEDLYLLWLKRVLELDVVIHAARSPQTTDDAIT